MVAKVTLILRHKPTGKRYKMTFSVMADNPVQAVIQIYDLEVCEILSINIVPVSDSVYLLESQPLD